MAAIEAVKHPGGTPGPLAITHAAVVPMDGPRVLGDHTVVIEGDRITRLGPAAEIDVTGCEVIDASGLHLAPGLADMHVHCWDTGEAGLFLANGVTLIRNMWGAPMHLAWQRKLRSGELLGPDLVTTSPIIDGPGEDGGTVWPGSPLLTEPEGAAAMVRAYADRGYQQIKAYSWLRLDTLAALGRAAREAGLRVTGHCPSGVTFEEAVEAGMSCFEHLTEVERGHLQGMEDPAPVRSRGGRLSDPRARAAFQHLDPEAIRRLGAFLAERQAWNCPTIVVSQGSAVDLDEARSDPRLRYLWPSMRASWDPANDFRSRGRDRSAWLDVARARVDALVEVLRVLHQEGAPILLGTDTPNPWVLPGFAIHDELDNLVAAGMSPFEAIACGTSQAAAFLGEADAWGTIATGKRAALVLLRTNPLEGVAAYREPQAVFVRGRHLSRGNLDALLENRARAVVAEIPAPELDEGQGGEVVAQGRLLERVAGVATARVAYRHRRLPDGGWQVEERGNSAGYGSDGRHHTSLELEADLTLRGGAFRFETELGSESCDMVRLPERGYRVTMTAVDGRRSEEEVTAGRLLPSERLAKTWPALLGAGANPADVPALDAAAEERTSAVSLALDRTAPGTWGLRVAREGMRSEQSWRFEEGKVAGVEEMTWRGLRELTPEATD